MPQDTPKSILDFLKRGDQPKDPAQPKNSDLMIRDPGAHKKPKKPWWRAYEDEDDNDLAKYETMPLSAVGGKTSSTTTNLSKAALPDSKGSSRVSGDNYQKAYMEQQALDRETPERKKEEDFVAKRKKEQEETKKVLDKRAEDNLRARARQIQDQIVFWEQQRGQGMYDDNIINGSIDDLKRELGNIPQYLWT